MTFAILGIKKHSSMASVGSRLGHQLRDHQVPNADPARKAENACTWQGTAASLVAAIKERVEPLKKRKDNVRAIELLLTASPEWFKEGGGAGDWKQLEKQAKSFVSDTFGVQNVMAFGVHLDEKTPHFWAMVTPVFEGKLRASHWLDGVPKMRKLQTEWAQRCEPLGLSRGAQGSKAQHIEVKDFYAASKGDAAAVKKTMKELEQRARNAENRVRKMEKALVREAEKLEIKAEKLHLMEEKLKQERAKIDAQRATNERLFKAMEVSVQKTVAEKYNALTALLQGSSQPAASKKAPGSSTPRP